MTNRVSLVGRLAARSFDVEERPGIFPLPMLVDLA
jgi:hypothetical protein